MIIITLYKVPSAENLQSDSRESGVYDIQSRRRRRRRIFTEQFPVVTTHSSGGHRDQRTKTFQPRSDAGQGKTQLLLQSRVRGECFS